jgi:quercetin dioxygenase-like cupin family protein
MDEKRMDRKPVFERAGGKPALNVLGDLITPLITGTDTGGGVEIFDLTGPHGSGPPPHDHPWDEAYILLDGKVDVVIGQDTTTVSRGDAVYIPAGTVHAYRIASSSARFIVLTSTAGAADFFADMDANVHHMPQDIDLLMEVTARNHVAVHAPAPA